MNTLAVLLNGPRDLHVGNLALKAPGAGDIVVDISHSGISTGTEKLFWTGQMPPFPGMGYPLVPGYESVGEVVEAGPDEQFLVTGPSVTDVGHAWMRAADCLGGDVVGRVGQRASLQDWVVV